MAAVQGPCPICHQEIVAPDPARGHEARIAPPPPPDEAQRQTEATAPPEEPAPAPHRGTRSTPICLTAAVCLLAGYLIGVRSRPELPTVKPPVKIPAAHREAPAPEPDGDETNVPPSQPEAPEPEPLKASVAAEAALKAFLDAPDWATRASHVLSPETVRSAMEVYSHTMPDGPTPYESITVQNSYTDRSTGNALFIFELVTTAHPTGIPVAVVEADGSWQVDWQTFIEFHDNHFDSFANGPIGESGRFHLIVSTPPTERAANTENEHFSSFLLDPPMPDRQRLAYVRKPSAIHATLKAATADGTVFTPVLELTKIETPSGKTYLEITGVVAEDWLPNRSGALKAP